MVYLKQLYLIIWILFSILLKFILKLNRFNNCFIFLLLLFRIQNTFSHNTAFFLINNFIFFISNINKLKCFLFLLLLFFIIIFLSCLWILNRIISKSIVSFLFYYFFNHFFIFWYSWNILLLLIIWCSNLRFLNFFLFIYLA